MRLNRIEIENFKGIGAQQVIDLRPITLLFGPNSAGKSTILQALHYVREIVERGNCDPDQTIAGGAVGLGGFASLVHGHDLSRKIRIAVTVDIQGDPMAMERLPGHFGLGVGDETDVMGRRLIPDSIERNEWLELDYFWSLKRSETEPLKTVGVEFEVSWSEFRQAAYLSCLTILLDGVVLACIKSAPEPGRAVLTGINFEHKMLERPESDDSDGDDIDKDEAARPKLRLVTAHIEHEAVEKGVGRFLETLVVFGTHAPKEFTSDLAVNVSPLSFPVETADGALPDINKHLKLSCRQISREEFEDTIAGRFDTLWQPDAGPYMDPEKHWEQQASSVAAWISEVFDEMLLGPLRIVKDCLEQLTYVGPLREIPARKYQPRQMIDEARWAQGLAAWDTLHARSSVRLLEEVNEWLAGESRLGTDYRLERAEIREVRTPSLIHQLFERGLTEDDLAELQELYLGLKVRVEVSLRDFRQGVVVAPGDVGVGISQVIPVLVGCLRDVPGILAIEQPELHLHPAVQVGLGDLMIRATQRHPDKKEPKSLLVETHSEHIMLRLLRRIRETTQGELPPGVLPLTADDLAVLFVEPSEKGVRFRALRVDKDGEFVDRWPRGFFEERDQELF
jgi:predicted ATPase